MPPFDLNHFHHQALFSSSENSQKCSNSRSTFIFSSWAQRWHFLNWPESIRSFSYFQVIAMVKNKRLTFVKEVFYMCIALKKLIFKFSFCNPQWKRKAWLFSKKQLFGNTRQQALDSKQVCQCLLLGESKVKFKLSLHCASPQKCILILQFNKYFEYPP